MPVHYEDTEARIHKIPMGPYGNNGYIVTCPRTGEGVIIDTPGEPEKLLRELGDTRVNAILITHRHSDHLLGFTEIKGKTGAPVGVHPDDAEALPQPPEIRLTDGQTIRVGDLSLKVLHTPGHTPGAACYLVGNHLFSGDTLFPCGPGVTGSSAAFQQVVDSIVGKLLALPDDTVVYPGHGDVTTIGKAREEYQVFASRPHPKDLHGHIQWLSI